MAEEISGRTPRGAAAYQKIKAAPCGGAALAAAKRRKRRKYVMTGGAAASARPGRRLRPQLCNVRIGNVSWQAGTAAKRVAVTVPAGWRKKWQARQIICGGSGGVLSAATSAYRHRENSGCLSTYCLEETASAVKLRLAHGGL